MSDPSSASERWKNLVVFLTVMTTVIAAAVASLQADANVRASATNRDSQYYAALVAAEIQRSGLQANYDLGIFATSLKDSLEANVLQLTALELEDKGDKAGAAAARVRAEAAAARAAQGRAFSALYTDHRYKPAEADGTPDMQQYVVDNHAKASELLAKQNDAADEYDLWNRKADQYVAVLTVLTIALFLLGLAQALSPRLRLLFAVFGVVATGAASLWTVIILVLG